MWIFGVAGVLLMCWARYRSAKSAGSWTLTTTKFFFGLLGAAGLLIGGVIVPIVSSPLLYRHPIPMFGLLCGAMIAFVAGVILIGRSMGRNVSKPGG